MCPGRDAGIGPRDVLPGCDVEPPVPDMPPLLTAPLVLIAPPVGLEPPVLAALLVGLVPPVEDEPPAKLLPPVLEAPARLAVAVPAVAIEPPEFICPPGLLEPPVSGLSATPLTPPAPFWLFDVDPLQPANAITHSN